METNLRRLMGLANAFKQLREFDMLEARSRRALLAHCTDDGARAFLKRETSTFAATARKWNQQLISAQRSLRHALAERRTTEFVRRFWSDRAAQAVRRPMVRR